MHDLLNIHNTPQKPPVSENASSHQSEAVCVYLQAPSAAVLLLQEEQLFHNLSAVLQRMRVAASVGEARDLALQLRRMCAAVRASLETHVRYVTQRVHPHGTCMCLRHVATVHWHASVCEPGCPAASDVGHATHDHVYMPSTGDSVVDAAH